MSTPDQHARYRANPRQCIDCAGHPSAGRPRCDTCHDKRHDTAILISLISIAMTL